MREEHCLQDSIGWIGRGHQKEEQIKNIMRHP
jgi:hypothetical protein